MSNDNQQHLNTDSQSLTDGSDEVQKKPKRQRKPSESKRLQSTLKAVQQAGLSPKALRFLADGGFEIRFDEDRSDQDNGFDKWFSDEMEEAHQ